MEPLYEGVGGIPEDRTTWVKECLKHVIDTVQDELLRTGVPGGRMSTVFNAMGSVSRRNMLEFDITRLCKELDVRMHDRLDVTLHNVCHAIYGRYGEEADRQLDRLSLMYPLFEKIEQKVADAGAGPFMRVNIHRGLAQERFAMVDALRAHKFLK